MSAKARRKIRFGLMLAAAAAMMVLLAGCAGSDGYTAVPAYPSSYVVYEDPAIANALYYDGRYPTYVGYDPWPLSYTRHGYYGFSYGGHHGRHGGHGRYGGGHRGRH